MYFQIYFKFNQYIHAIVEPRAVLLIKFQHVSYNSDNIFKKKKKRKEKKVSTTVSTFSRACVCRSYPPVQQIFCYHVILRNRVFFFFVLFWKN